MKLHVLGAGGPRPGAGAPRYGTSCILDMGTECILLDCGPATTYKMARMDLSPTQVNTVLLSHHHTDHNVDFPCFSLLRFDLDNGDLPPLDVYGPAPTQAFVEGLVGEQGLFAPDVVSRREHPVALHNYVERGGKLPRPQTKAQGHDIVSGSVFETDTWKVTAVQVPHLGPYLVSLAYRIDSDEGSVLFLADAGISPALIEMAKGVDTLVTGVLRWNTRIGDPPDSHHNVSADIPDVIDVLVGADMGRLVGIHGSGNAEGLKKKLQDGYNGMRFAGEVLCPAEMTTIDL